MSCAKFSPRLLTQKNTATRQGISHTIRGVFAARYATAHVIVIEHDLDVINNANYIIDMGPGGGKSGGQIVATGAPSAIKANAKSITGKFLKRN